MHSYLISLDLDFHSPTLGLGVLWYSWTGNQATGTTSWVTWANQNTAFRSRDCRITQTNSFLYYCASCWVVCRVGWITTNIKRSALDIDITLAFLGNEEKPGVICNKKSIRYFVVQCLIRPYFANLWKDDSVKIFISMLYRLISLILG